MSTLFLINPTSGRKRNGAKVASLIESAYQEARQAVEVQEIDFSRLDQMLAAAIQRGIQQIYAVGGDGTVNAIGTRLIHRAVNFGVIPNGSGNGYARNIGFSIRTPLAISQSINASVRKVDTGRFGNVPFLNVAGVGLDAEVAFQFANGSSRGFVPYARSSAEGLLSAKGNEYRLTMDGKRETFSDIVGIAVANGTQWGYNATISADSSLTDGWLEVLVVKRFPIIKAGLMVGKLFSRTFQDSRYVHRFQARKVLIERDAAGPAQIDGEPIEAPASIAVEIVPQSLNLLLPATLTEEKLQSI
ncbi:MAG: diacylglycerol kinase family protein [Bacteroidota bacterium]